MFRLCSYGSSVVCRCVTPRRRTCGPCGSAFARRPATWLSRRCLRGLPVLVHEVSRRVWGLRLRRTGQALALALLLMLPTAHYKDGGVRIASFRSWIPTPPSPCLRFTESLAVSAQDSGPSRSLVFTRSRVRQWRGPGFV